MHPKPAQSDDVHPEFSRSESRDIPFDDLTTVACAPNPAMQLTEDLWPAWRVLPLWRRRVEAELPGDFARLLLALVFAPGAELDGAAAGTARFTSAAANEPVAEYDEPDESPEGLIDFLQEELYRLIFAMGAAWAQTRCERS